MDFRHPTFSLFSPSHSPIQVLIYIVSLSLQVSQWPLPYRIHFIYILMRFQVHLVLRTSGRSYSSIISIYRLYLLTSFNHSSPDKFLGIYINYRSLATCRHFSSLRYTYLYFTPSTALSETQCPDRASQTVTDVTMLRPWDWRICTPESRTRSSK